MLIIARQVVGFFCLMQFHAQVMIATGLNSGFQGMERHLLAATRNLAPTCETPLRVTVVGENAKTVGSLRSYLTGAGVESDALQQLPDVAMLARLGDALVLFPDDFDTSAVQSTLENVQRLRPQLRLLLVTSAPQRYQRRQSNDTAHPPILLPKPAFGWSILDAIRDSVSRYEESS